MERVILLKGFPGSGKSEWTKRFLKEHEDENWIVVNRDSIRGMLNPLYWTPNIEVITKGLKIDAILKASQQQYNIIVDETHLTKESLEKYFSHDFPYWFKESHTFEVGIMTTPFEICKGRNALREPRWKVPEERMQEMLNIYNEEIPEGMTSFMINNI